MELQIDEDQTNWSLDPNILSSEDIELICNFPKILLEYVHNWIQADEESKNTVNDDGSENIGKANFFRALYSISKTPTDRRISGRKYCRR
jgi:hypothetical protein